MLGSVFRSQQTLWKFAVLYRNYRFNINFASWPANQLKTSKYYGKLQNFKYCTKVGDVKIVLSEQELKRNLEDISDKFSESMVSLDDAKSSVGTVYFSEDVKEAQDYVHDTLNDYKILCDKLKDDQKIKVVKTIGLKMKELEAQLKLMEELMTES